jgi:hypothetical protein
MITKEQADDRFFYVEDTGELFDRMTGAIAGRVEKNRNTSYRKMYAFGKTIRAHQIVWVIFYGVWPDGEVDHEDGDGLNNRISNLRCGTRSQNQRNQRPGKRNKSGFIGISWQKAEERWQVHIWIDGKRKNIGSFKRLKHAVAARRTAADANGYAR